MVFFTPSLFEPKCLDLSVPVFDVTLRYLLGYFLFVFVVVSDESRYGSVDEGGYDRNSNSNNGYGGRGDYDQGGEGRGGRGAARGMGRGRGRGRAGGGRGAGRGRQGYFTDGRGGQALGYEGDDRGGRSSRQAGERGRGRGRGRQDFEGGERRHRDDFGGGGSGRGTRTEETGRGGVWGYEDDDDDDVVGIRPTRAPADAAVRVESSFGADGEVDDGSLGSRMGPVDREHFYSVKVCYCLTFSPWHC